LLNRRRDHLPYIQRFVIAFALGHRHWVMNVNLFNELAISREYLQSEVLAVGNNYTICAHQTDVVRETELTLIGSRLSPGCDVLAFRIKLVNA